MDGLRIGVRRLVSLSQGIGRPSGRTALASRSQHCQHHYHSARHKALLRPVVTAHDATGASCGAAAPSMVVAYGRRSVATYSHAVSNAAHDDDDIRSMAAQASRVFESLQEQQELQQQQPRHRQRPSPREADAASAHAHDSGPSVRDISVYKSAQALNEALTKATAFPDLVLEVRRAVTADAAMAKQLGLRQGTPLRPCVANLHNLATAFYRTGRLVQGRARTSVPAKRSPSRASGAASLARPPDDTSLLWLIMQLRLSLSVSAAELFSLTGAPPRPAHNDFDAVTPRGLSNIAWAAARLLPLATDTERSELTSLLNVVAPCVEALARSFSARDLALTAWSFAEAGVPAPRMFASMGAVACDSPDSFNMLDVGDLLWGFAFDARTSPGHHAIGAAEERSANTADGDPAFGVDSVTGQGAPPLPSSIHVLEAFGAHLPAIFSRESRFHAGAFMQVVHAFHNTMPPSFEDVITNLVEEALNRGGCIDRLSPRQLVQLLAILSGVSGFSPGVFAAASTSLLNQGAGVGGSATTGLATLGSTELVTLTRACVSQAYHSPPLLVAILDELALSASGGTAGSFRACATVLRELGRVGWDADVAAHVARVLRRLRLPPRPAAAPLVWLAEYVARTRQEVPELLAKLGDHAAHMYAASLMRERQLLAVAWSLASMGLVGHDVVKAALSVPVGDAPVLTHVKQYVPVAAV